MRSFKRYAVTIVAALCLTVIAAVGTMADDGQKVYDFPGFQGSGTKQTGPIEGSVSGDCWFDEDDYNDIMDDYEDMYED